jgi:hypothetical protein
LVESTFVPRGMDNGVGVICRSVAFCDVTFWHFIKHMLNRNLCESCRGWNEDKRWNSCWGEEFQFLL